MIVVTGGAGFIGSNLLAGLEERGYGPLSVVDELGRRDKWKNLRRRELEELVPPEDVFELLERDKDEISYVFHMGAVSATTEKDADLIVQTNIRLPQALWDWCTHNGVPFLYASSAATYGDGAHGFDDDGSPEALEKLLPLNAYGWSKHAFDRWVARRIVAGEATPPQWVGLKFFNVYGPNEYHKEDMRSVVTKAYPGAAAGEPVTLFRSHHPDYPDGGQMRDFVYVKDCVDVMIWLMEHPEVDGLFNLGTGKAQTWLELMGALYAAVGREMQVEWKDTPEDIRDKYQYFTQAEMGRLRAAGYDQPFRSVEEGVEDYVKQHLAAEDPYR
ncbi:MAG TPA: ADP-glyceromanno-heptose 6-epimerase [Longimicrobiales bacterium]|nr:ADP-glyceromanno-heptose 6-epimerase [Longimicrobiales bacterium]